ncbi:hypothetical protein E2P86_04220 [Sphingobacterium psychroaquaticum]|uniref:hypothetical protein n=1 Tax=Sphingobacterium psychroaquaticum TaxID=561061 RepID=UPI0010697DC9|nr:hypothetical protein [Sphingobacterium psychroaquaticum]QBQ40399.1 hypothetical protein E2P86_04220 [Sphingobacterium psychroaquaticum]
MKLRNYLFLLSVLALSVLGCKKYEIGYDGEVRFTSYSLEPTAHPGLAAPVHGTIDGNTVYIRVPNSVNINQAKPSFQSSSEQAIVYLDNKVQESGVSVVNMSDTLNYRIASPNDMGFVQVIALRNAAIVSFGFYAADNENVLFRDYVAKFDGLHITVDLPIDADVTKLVARYKTTENAVVKVNGTVQTSQKSANDFNQEVIYEVTDAETIAPEKFVIKIGRLTAPEWLEMPLGPVGDFTVGEVSMALNPLTNQPAILFTRSASDGDKTRKAVAAQFDGATWKLLGTQDGISAGRTDAPGIAIDDNGIIYASYKDYETQNDSVQYASIQKYENNSWKYLNKPQGTAHRVNYLHIATNASNIPVLGYSAARAEAGAANRSTVSAFFTNGAWSTRMIDAAPATLYTRVRKGRDNKVYYAVMDGISTTRRPTIYRLNDNSLMWERVGTAMITPSPTVYGANLMDVEASEAGEVYVVFQSQANADKKSYVMKYDGATWRQIGSEISHNASGNSTRDNIALAIHPNGILYFAHSDANGIKVMTFDPLTQNWTPAKTISTVNGDKLTLRIADDGIPFLATVVDGKVKIYRYDIP